MSKKNKTQFIIDYPITTSCRSVGPGGTRISFYPQRDKIKVVWENETCPSDDIELDNDGAALDGHNVSYIDWDNLAKLLEKRPK